jgi:hypothetical protein
LAGHVILSSVLLAAVALLCYWRLRAWSSRRGRVDQGEYRMVAAQYVDSAFDESLSDGGDDDEDSYGNGNANDDFKDDGGWAKRGTKSIEMNAIDREANGGLTLEEMNG